MASITPKNGRVAFVAAHDPDIYYVLDSTDLGTNYGDDSGGGTNTNVGAGDIGTAESYDGMDTASAPPTGTDLDSHIINDACALVYIPAGLAHGTVYGLFHNGGGTNGQGGMLRATTTGVEIACSHNNGNATSQDTLIEEIPDADLPGWFCFGFQFNSNGGTEGDMGLWLNGSLVRSATRTYTLDWGSGNPQLGDANHAEPNQAQVRDPGSYTGGDWGADNVINSTGILIANFVTDNPSGGASDTSAGNGDTFHTDYYDEHVVAADTEVNTLYNSNNTLAIATFDANVGINVKPGTDALTIATSQATVTLVAQNISFDETAFDEPNAFDINAFSMNAGGVDTEVTTNAPDALVLTEYVASIDINVIGTADALTLSEQQATISLDVNVDTNVDALLIAEQAAEISLDIDIDATTDALSIAEQTAEISLDIDIDTNVDALVISEKQATVSLGINVDTNVDALVISEKQATVNSETNVDTVVDALVIATYQASVVVGGDTEVAAKVYAMELDVYTATINAATGIDASTDTLAIATYQAQVTADQKSFDSTSFDEPNAFDRDAFAIYEEVDTEVSATIDALVLTEYPATVSLDAYVDQQATTALTITEYVADIGFVIPAVIAFDNGAFDEPNAFSINSFAIEVGTPSVNTNLAELVLTEYPATIFADREISASTDTLVLTTYPAQLDQDTSVDAQTDALILTEYQANIAAAGVMMAGSTTLTINENRANVSAGVAGSTDALVITEYQSTIVLDVVVQTNADALTLATGNATIKVDVNSVNIECTTDQLVVATYSATIVKDTIVEANTDTLVIATQQAGVGLDLRLLVGFDALVINTYPVDTPVFTPNVRTVVDELVLTEYPAVIMGPGGAGGKNEDEARLLQERKRREEAARERARRDAERAKQELDKLFPEDISEELAALAETGTGTIGGVEVEITPIVKPVRPVIKLKVASEAERTQLEAKYQEDVRQYRASLLELEDQLVMFLMMMMDD